MRRIICCLCLIAVALPACGELEKHRNLEQSLNAMHRVNVGQVVLRLNKTKDLPNAFGKADLFGRKLEVGFEELRFLGMENENIVLLGYRDQEIVSNETTMSRSGVGFVNLQRYGNTTSGIITSPQASTRHALAPTEVLIRHDLTTGTIVEHSGVKIEIQKVTPNELRYILSGAE